MAELSHLTVAVGQQFSQANNDNDLGHLRGLDSLSTDPALDALCDFSDDEDDDEQGNGENVKRAVQILVEAIVKGSDHQQDDYA